MPCRPFLILSLITSLFLFPFLSCSSAFAYTSYKRCWVKNGIVSLNCNPADGHSFEKINGLYKKCPIHSGKQKNSCTIQDGYGMFYKDNFWYQCPIQQGKKSDSCNLANGYQIIRIP